MDDITIVLPGKVAEKLREMFPALEPWEVKVSTAIDYVEAYEKKVALMGFRGQCPFCQRKLSQSDKERLGLR